MADISLTKIFTGMEDGPEQIDSNFQILNVRQEKTSEVTITLADNTVAGSTVTALDGKLTRYRNIVTLSLHVVGTMPSDASQTLDVYKIPVGYQPSDIATGQLPLSLESGATITNPRAFLYATAQGTFVTLRSNTGASTYVSGFWITADDTVD